MLAKSLTKSNKAGRPPTLEMPDSIPETLEIVMDALLTTPPKKAGEWKYLKGRRGA